MTSPETETLILKKIVWSAIRFYSTARLFWMVLVLIKYRSNPAFEFLLQAFKFYIID